MQKIELSDILSNSNFDDKEYLVWYVSIIWRPNTWKSTFVNTLIWEKISITSNVPQTTRQNILAIYNDDESQIIFLDTPGIHNSDKLYNEKINSNAINSIEDADVILYFIDSSRQWGDEEEKIKDLIKNIKKPIIKVYTKSDLNPKINIDKESLTISSITQKWYDELIKQIKSHLNTWTLFFPQDYYTKQDIYFRINEIIREKAFFNLKDEIPHSIYVKTEEIEESDDLLKIVAYIYTETESQKTIVIWKWWGQITKIWKESREELEDIFDKKVFLALRVKVNKNWKKNEKLLNKII